MTFLARLFPSDTWSLFIGISLIECTVLAAIFIGDKKLFSGTKYFLYAVLPISILLTLDTYLDMSKYEKLRSSSGSGKIIIDEKDGIQLNTYSFRAQRNFYISFFTLALTLITYGVRNLNKRVTYNIHYIY